MARQLAAWERDGKWYLSAFVGARTHANGKTPAREFDSRAELEEYATTRADSRRRRADVIFEYEGESPVTPLLPPPDGENG